MQLLSGVQRWRLLFFQITDGSLIQLSIHCPRLQVLVSARPPVKHILFWFLHFWWAHAVNWRSCNGVPAELVSLRADHWWWHQTSWQRPLCPWSPGGDRAGQLPPDNRRFSGAPEELPQPGPHWALRLPADYPGWHQETKGEWFGIEAARKQQFVIYYAG